jgi:hypothetical protein
MSKSKETAKKSHFRKNDFRTKQKELKKRMSQPQNQPVTRGELFGVQQAVFMKMDVMFFMLSSIWITLDKLKVVSLADSKKAAGDFGKMYSGLNKIISEHKDDDLMDDIIEEATKLEGCTAEILDCIFGLVKGAKLRPEPPQQAPKEEKSRIITPTEQQKRVILSNKQ